MAPAPLLVIATFALASTAAPAASAAEKENAAPGCTAAREYITALEFLRDRKDFQVPEPEARRLAERVAGGCTGAALRFVRVARILTASGLGAADALRVGGEFAGRADADADAFIQVFTTAFSRDHLDMDIRSSIEIARSLSSEFQGDLMAAREDFKSIAKHCLDAKDLDLPRPGCADLAARIARKGRKFEGGIARPYLETLDFLRSRDGANLTAGDALKTAEALMEAGPGAGENFIVAFRYASSEKGLAFTNRDAVAFAYQLATRKRD